MVGEAKLHTQHASLRHEDGLETFPAHESIIKLFFSIYWRLEKISREFKNIISSFVCFIKDDPK